jgi:hypothetical protein
MRICIITHSGRTWYFNSLKVAKALGALKKKTKLSDANEIIVIHGIKTAVYR